jgi:hypothetical protein
MADMFKAFKLPIFIQTCSSEHLSEIRPEMANWRVQIPWFKLGNHEHVARLLLLCQVRMFTKHRDRRFPEDRFAPTPLGRKPPERRAECV